MPIDASTVAVLRWTMHPNPQPLVVPAQGGSVFVVVESGHLTATQTGINMSLVAGQRFAPADPERDFALHVSGREAASRFIVSFALHGRSDPTKYGRNARVHTVQVLIQAPAGEFSSPSGRLVPERLTMPSGSTLPPDQANPLVWSGVAEGALEMTLPGQMPFLWELGQERTLRPGQARPQIPGPGPNPLMAGGTQVALHNAGTSPLVLYHLTLTPTTGKVAAAA